MIKHYLMKDYNQQLNSTRQYDMMLTYFACFCSHILHVFAHIFCMFLLTYFACLTAARYGTLSPEEYEKMYSLLYFSNSIITLEIILRATTHQNLIYSKLLYYK